MHMINIDTTCPRCHKSSTFMCSEEALDNDVFVRCNKCGLIFDYPDRLQTPVVEQICRSDIIQMGGEL